MLSMFTLVKFWIYGEGVKLTVLHSLCLIIFVILCYIYKQQHLYTRKKIERCAYSCNSYLIGSPVWVWRYKISQVSNLAWQNLLRHFRYPDAIQCCTDLVCKLSRRNTRLMYAQLMHIHVGCKQSLMHLKGRTQSYLYMCNTN